MITLRPASAADLAFVVALELRPETAPWTGLATEPEHRRALADPDFRYLMIEADGATIGYMILRGLTSPARSIELKRIVLDRPGAGQGRATLALLQRLVFADWGMNRLWLDVFVDNERARRAYRAAGFVEEGMLREAFRRRDGVLMDTVVMSVLAREWSSQR